MTLSFLFLQYSNVNGDSLKNPWFATLFPKIYIHIPYLCIDITWIQWTSTEWSLKVYIIQMKAKSSSWETSRDMCLYSLSQILCLFIRICTVATISLDSENQYLCHLWEFPLLHLYKLLCVILGWYTFIKIQWKMYVVSSALTII